MKAKRAKEREEEKQTYTHDMYSFEQRCDFIKTNLRHISQKVKVEKTVEILEPLM